MKVAIIGGGPSGLVTLKTLITAHESLPATEPIEARLFEAESSVGGTFKYRDYEESEMVSSRQLTTFSDFRYGSEALDFLSTKEYCQYLEKYCENFNLAPHIYLQTTISSVQRVAVGGHVIFFNNNGQDGEWHCDAVAICSGLHVTPNIPHIPGLESVPTVMHSSQFKTRAQFGKGQDVLIVGSGETGMDIAHLAVTADTNSVTLCHRDGFMIGSKRAPEPSWLGMAPASTPQGSVPYDVGAASLFDTAYVHPYLRDSFLSWWYYDTFIKFTNWLVSGTKAGLDQWIGEISPERFHMCKIFVNKSTKALPYISAPYRTTSLVNTIRSYISQIPLPYTGDRVIDLAPWPQSISEKGMVTFTENARPEAETMRSKICKPDVLILATGYTQSFPFLSDKSYPLPKDANVRSIWKDTDNSVAFIGFIRPSFGAIPPLAELQALLWTLSLTHHLPSLPSLGPHPHYKLFTPPQNRITYGVDHESYAYQLALDMGSAPSISDILPMGPKMVACWALSANVGTKFRLMGPWKWGGARGVMEGEIWETVCRRGGFWGVVLGVMPVLVFGVANAGCWVLSWLAVWAMWCWKVLVGGEY